jgi:gluconokinase
MRSLVLGVDVGTSNAKCVAFADGARPVATAVQGYGLRVPEPGAAEQDPHEVFEAVVAAVGRVVAEVGPSSVSRVGFSAAMHSVVPVDEHGDPLMSAITYADMRSRAETEWLRNNGGMTVYRRTGTPLHPMSPLSKLRWLSAARPDVVAAARWFLSLKDWILWRLTGTLVTDHSTASASGLFNLNEKNWDDAALDAARVTATALPELVPTTHLLEGAGVSGVRGLGLSSRVPFCVGATDGVLANLGVGAVRPGVFGVSVGTSGALRVVVDAPVTDEHGATFCYVLAHDKWVAGGPVSNGGLVLRWLRDNFGAPETERAEDGYRALDELAARVPPGARGLVFAPYLTGERAPSWDLDARGALIGLTLEHGKPEVVRAAMEGVALSLALVAQSLDHTVPGRVALRATGGFTRSPLWLQIVASALETEIEVPDVGEASCLGAAWLSLVATGDVELDDIVDSIVVKRRVAPDAVAAHTYRDLLPLFASLLPELRDHFAKLRRIEGGTPSDDRSAPDTERNRSS